MHREFTMLDSILAGDERGVLMTVHDDPSTVFAFCHGEEIPLLDITAEGAELRLHYTNCPLWQREKARIESGAEAIFPRPTSRPSAASTLGRTAGVLAEREGRAIAKAAQAAATGEKAVDWLFDEGA